MDKYFVTMQTKLPSGLSVLTMRTPVQGIVAGIVQVKWGAAHAAHIGPQWAGLPHFMEHLIINGASQGYKAGQIKKLFNKNYGVDLNGATNQARTQYWSDRSNAAVFLKEHVWDAFHQGVDSIFRPKFDRKTLNTQKGRVLEEMGLRNTPQTKAMLERQMLRFGTAWLGINAGGTSEAVLGYTQKQLADFHKDYYVQANTTVAFAGDIEHAEAVERVSEIMVGVPETGKVMPVLETPVFQRGEHIYVDPRGSEGYVNVALELKGAGLTEETEGAEALTIRGLSRILFAEMEKRHSLYESSVMRYESRNALAETKITFASTKPEKWNGIIETAMDVLYATQTRTKLVRGLKEAIQECILESRKMQIPIDEIAGELARRDMWGMPLRDWGSFFQEIQSVTPKDVRASIDRMCQSPIFLSVTGHKDAVEKVPSLEEIEAIRQRFLHENVRKSKFGPKLGG